MAEKKEESFEAMLKKLEDVVMRLEKGDLPLEESLKAYEDGVGLVRAAQGRLDGMDKKLEQLLKDGTTKSIDAPADES
jgi:exodeoxyribonuclease VII small subunit